MSFSRMKEVREKKFVEIPCNASNEIATQKFFPLENQEIKSREKVWIPSVSHFTF